MFNFGIRYVVEDEYGWGISFHCGCEAWHTLPIRYYEDPKPFTNSWRCVGTHTFRS